MIYEIMPIADDHIDGFHQVLDTVAREKRFLSFWKRRRLNKRGLSFSKTLRSGRLNLLYSSMLESEGGATYFPILEEQ